MTLKNHELDPSDFFWCVFMCVCLNNKLESFTVDLRFDRYVKLGQFNAIILDLIRRVWAFSF